MLQVTSTATFLLSAASQLGLDAVQREWLLAMAKADPSATLSLTIAPAEPAVDPLTATLRNRYHLTNREAEVALLLAERCSAKEIARRLGLSVFTVHSHTQQVLAKLRTRRSGVRDICLRLASKDGKREEAA